MLFLQTGQAYCYDNLGHTISCEGTGQDAEFKDGLLLPSKRFDLQEEVARDLLTGLTWTVNANIAEYPLTWQEAFDFVSKMNSEKFFGFNDWRLPNRHELRSLMSYQSKNPSLPLNHPFKNIFLGWYWTSTTAAIHPGYAWYIHLEGARMFYGRKDQYYLLWPVRGAGKNILPVTGQTICYDSLGAKIDPVGTGQDGEFQIGREWPIPRFIDKSDFVTDRLTNLCWLKNADLTGKPVSWDEAFSVVKNLNSKCFGGINNWRLPNINALASLVDSSAYEPALPDRHPFQNLQNTYWSSTTSYFETDWAWALYLNKGALGVGHKIGKNFYVWAAAICPR